jgi:hypothetical protein
MSPAKPSLTPARWLIRNASVIEYKKGAHQWLTHLVNLSQQKHVQFLILAYHAVQFLLALVQ